VHIFATERKLVKNVRVGLEGFTQFLGLSIVKCTDKRQVFLERELFVNDGAEVWLEQGVNTSVLLFLRLTRTCLTMLLLFSCRFEFTFTVPSTTATSERSPTGICQYHVSATVASPRAKTSPLLTASREVIVVCQPHRESNVLQYQHHHEASSRIFGPYSLDLSSNVSSYQLHLI
jgi:hypothetical protein